MKIKRRYPYNRKELRDTLEFYNYKCNERGKNEFSKEMVVFQFLPLKKVSTSMKIFLRPAALISYQEKSLFK